MLRAAIAILIIATVIGAIMPSLSPGPDDAGNAAAAEPWFGESKPAVASSASGSSSQGWGSANGSTGASGGEVRLNRRGNGHFYADVEVNGTIVEFMVDTGASGIAMTEADARRAGIALDEGGRSYVGEGAGGALTGHVVRLDRVRLGDQSATAVRAVVIDGASTNLLGQAFLTRFSEVIVRGDVMTLR